MTERYGWEPRQIKTQCQNDLYFFYGPPIISAGGVQVQGSFSNRQGHLQVTGGSGITFSCQVGTKEQSCISLAAQTCFSSLGLSLQPQPWSRQRRQSLASADLKLGHPAEKFRVEFVSSHIRDLETCGCLQLSESSSGTAAARGENWQFQGVIHVNILDISFRLGLIIPDYSNPVAQVRSVMCVIFDPRI